MADLPQLAQLPSAQLLVATDRLRTAFSRERPGLFVGRALHRQAKAGLLLPGLRAWALTLSEVACARLPGGELVPDGDGVTFLPGVPDDGRQDHDRTCGCGDYRNHAGERWMRHMTDTMHAVRDRDGERLFDLFDRAVYGLDAVASTVTNYTASLASSSCVAAAEAGLPRELDAMLHSLAFHAHVARQWSVAGPVYRLAAAVVTARDIGAGMADAIIGPEIEALGKLGTLRITRAMSVVGPALAEVVTDDPAEPMTSIEVYASEAGHPMRADGPQARAVDLASQFVLAYRSPEAEAGELMPALVDQAGPEGIALAVYGATNLFALRMRELYG